MLNKIVHIKPSILNPSIKISAKAIMSALIINKNNPRVTIVMGMVRIMSMGLTIKFNKLIAIATMIAET